jgi:hypothetical protein
VSLCDRSLSINLFVLVKTPAAIIEILLCITMGHRNSAAGICGKISTPAAGSPTISIRRV